MNSTEPDTRPMLVPCRTVKASAPWRWLKLGWRDFKQSKGLSLAYGLVMMLISVVITWISYQAHSLVLAIAITAGFFFIGPTIGIGLYSISRQIGRGEQPNLWRSLKAGKRNWGNAMILSLFFLIVFLVWARAASMVHIFFPSLSSMDFQNWLNFLAIGSAVGAVFAAVIFCAGAFSIPMLIDRDVDAITSVITSVNAVLKNKLTMLLWGLLIVFIVCIGIVTLYLGFVVLLPVVGHATWHAYLETIDAVAWDSDSQ